MADLTAHSFTQPAFTKPAFTHPVYDDAKPLIHVHLMRRFWGVVFSFSALGLWLAPGASDTVDALLLRTGLTGVLIICSLAALLPRR